MTNTQNPTQCVKAIGIVRCDGTAVPGSTMCETHDGGGGDVRRPDESDD